jgi:hypothetical protein
MANSRKEGKECVSFWSLNKPLMKQRTEERGYKTIGLYLDDLVLSETEAKMDEIYKALKEDGYSTSEELRTAAEEQEKYT